MELLPWEIVLDILSRLPIPSLVQSKSVCRAWHSLIQDPVLVNKHFWRTVENDPGLILQTDHPVKNQLYFGDFSTDRNDGNLITTKLSMPPLLNLHLVSSCNGLLCLRASSVSFGLCIYNPFTRDYTELPKLTKPRCHGGLLGFGFDPTTKEYKVIVKSYDRRPFRPFYVAGSTLLRPQVAASTSIEAAVHILTIGNPTWRNLGNLPFHLRLQRSQVLVNGKLHWVSYRNRYKATNPIISFDLTTEQFQEVPRPDCINMARRSAQLVVLRGCLAAASYQDDSEQLEIWVMTEYSVKESWVKEFSIGTHVPQILQQNGCGSFNHPRLFLSKKCIRVLCLLRSGKILLEYKNKALVLYDPHCGTFKDLQLKFQGIQKCFKVVVHVASLNWIDSFLNT
ncbi:F-box protein At3g07870-like [Durio zibethinus]|uniref:F-box protein At3g07870-like n=1 Tax=Durio zibethinus TaxID=66656 RepID=A0A6P5XIU9_DURZI|nr:F-box protein At3g07870-like [Durio zibethinus]